LSHLLSLSLTCGLLTSSSLCLGSLLSLVVLYGIVDDSPNQSGPYYGSSYGSRIVLVIYYRLCMMAIVVMRIVMI